MTIDEFINSLEGGLYSWVHSHSKEGWIEHYEDLNEVHEDFLDTAQKVIAEDMQDDYSMYICNGCYSSWDSYDIEDYNKCPDCGKFCQEFSDEMYLGWVQDVYYDVSMAMDALTDHQLYRVLEIEYQKWVTEAFPEIPILMEEAQYALEGLETAKAQDDPVELLAAVLMAAHCAHVGGMIATDYGDLDWNDIYAISNEGLEALFDIEEIEDYLMI